MSRTDSRPSSADADDDRAAERTADSSTADLPGATDGESESDSLALDEVFTLLKNERRRRVLEFLDRTTNPVSLGELAEHIAALEQDTTVDQLHSDERKRVYVALYQGHLPKLDDAGVVDYDKNRGTIALNEDAAAQLQRYLAVANGETNLDGRPWHGYAAGLAVAGALAYLLGFLFLSPGHPVTAAAVGGLAVGVVACSLARAVE